MPELYDFDERGIAPKVRESLEYLDNKEGGSDGSAAWTDITGKPAVIAAGADAVEARTVIGAGTSNLAIGATATTAAAGNHTHAAATTAAIGMVKMAAAQADSTSTDAAGVVSDFNALLAKLRTAGLLANS